MPRDAVIVLTGRQHRTQERNRAEIIEHLFAMIRAAAVRPVKRRATKPSFGERQRRLDTKSHRAGIKRGQGGPVEE